MGKMSRIENFFYIRFVFLEIFLDKPLSAEYTELVNRWLLLGGGHILSARYGVQRAASAGKQISLKSME
jgi:hypothetical protein